MPRNLTFWLDEPRDQVATRLGTSVTGAGEFQIRRLSDDGGELLGGLNGATWGRTIDFTLVPERGGTAVNARWKPRYPLQFITWGQENRDLAWLRKVLTSPAAG